MPDDLDPNKYHVLSNNQKRMLTLILVVSALITVPTFSFFYYNLAINRPAQIDKEMTFAIPNGSSIVTIASELETEKLINSAFLFKLYIFLNKFDKNIQAGVYKIPTGSSLVQLVDLLRHGVNDTTITFLEGWRVEQYAVAASTQFKKIDYNIFYDSAAKYEGYLFPDTYSFPADVTEEQIIGSLIENFNIKTKDLLSEENLKKVKMTKEQVIDFASIIEREVQKEEDKQVVAGILIKRWKNNELIGADATTQYAVAKIRNCSSTDLKCPGFEVAKSLEWWPKELTREDLQIDSPYNTRKNLGLIPAPISNPGLSTIRAVIFYTESPYSYYLTDKDGVTHFSKTLEEHNSNVQKYL